MNPSQNILDLVRDARKVAFFTGAGMSADSGVSTFRDKQTGLWSQVDPQAMATVDAWHADPTKIWPWYLWRLSLVRNAQPHSGHLAIADWSKSLAAAGGWGHVTTQNIDDLHERAGSRNVAHLHGSLSAFRCDSCGTAADEEPVPPETEVEFLQPPRCTHCETGLIRPGVVWFGEMLPAEPWNQAQDHILDADLVVVVGTSGVVYPAAGLPLEAIQSGIRVIEISPDDTDLTPHVTESWRTTAAQGLPLLAAQV